MLKGEKRWPTMAVGLSAAKLESAERGWAEEKVDWKD